VSWWLGEDRRTHPYSPLRNQKSKYAGIKLPVSRRMLRLMDFKMLKVQVPSIFPGIQGWTLALVFQGF